MIFTRYNIWDVSLKIKFVIYFFPEEARYISELLKKITDELELENEPKI